MFKAGGDLAFHHGGPSLQELIVPVLTVRMKVRDSARTTDAPMTATGLPDAVTNRIFSVTLQLGGQNLSLFSSATVVRPLLMSSGKQVGAVGMAIDAELDRATGCVKLQPGKPVTVAFLLERRERRLAPRRRAGPDHRRGAVPLADRHPGSTWSLNDEQRSSPRARRARRQGEPALRRQGRPQGPRPEGQGRRERAGVRARVSARKVLRVVGRNGDPDGAAGRQRHAREQLHPAGRVGEGAEQGQGEREVHLHRQGEGPPRRLRLLGGGGQLRKQVPPRPDAVRARLRAAPDGRRLGAARHAL